MLMLKNNQTTCPECSVKLRIDNVEAHLQKVQSVLFEITDCLMKYGKSSMKQHHLEVHNEILSDGDAYKLVTEISSFGLLSHFK